MLFQLHGSIGYFMEMLLGGIKSHKPLHQLSQKQFIKITDHSCLMVQSCCFVGWNEKRYCHAKKISTYFLNLLGTTEKHYTSLVQKVWRGRNVWRKRSICSFWMWDLLKLWKHFVWQSSTALANQQGRQLMSMEHLKAQCRVYFKWIWKCSYTKISVVHKINGGRKWLQFIAWAGRKDEILFNTWFPDEAYF